MNETSASIPRAERKHAPQLTWRAWVARALVGAVVSAIVVAVAYGNVILFSSGFTLGLGFFEFIFRVAVVCADGGAAIFGVVFCVDFVDKHINERK